MYTNITTAEYASVHIRTHFVPTTCCTTRVLLLVVALTETYSKLCINPETKRINKHCIRAFYMIRPGIGSVRWHMVAEPGGAEGYVHVGLSLSNT